MTVAELITAVRAIVGDKLREDPNNPGTFLQGATDWTDPEIKTALDWACQRYAEETSCSLTEASVNSAANGIVRLTAGVLAVHGASGSAGALERTSMTLEDTRDPNWRTVGTTEKRWMPWGDHAIRISPALSGKAILVTYTASPASVTGGSVDSTIPAGHHNYLPLAAASYLLAQAGDTQDLNRAGAFQASFYAMIGHPKGGG